jgi:putative spermidine/putrescine transport system substrate-binding protein
MTNALTRRRFLGTVAATGAATLAAPSILRAADGPLRVGTYGGFFEESFAKHIYPAFTEETGIEVESLAVPTGETWLVQIKNAARAKTAPADVGLMAGTPRREGAKQKVFKTIDAANIPNLDNLHDRFKDKYDDGGLYGVGGVAWYITLCTNSDVIPEAPTSWTALWDSQYKDQIGLLGLATNSFLLEVTATTYFGGTDILATRDGIEQVFEKLSELVPNVRLWYKDEGSFQQALQTGEIPMGQYYHDVAGLAAADGYPVVSTFPKEGGILDSGYWVVPEFADADEKTAEFLNFMCKPETQALLARNLGTAPVIDTALTDLTPEEVAAVTSAGEPIIPRYEMYGEFGDWISDRWSQMIAG